MLLCYNSPYFILHNAEYMPKQDTPLPKRTRRVPKKLSDYQLSSKIAISEMQTKTFKNGKRNFSSQVGMQTFFSSPKRSKANKFKGKTDKRAINIDLILRKIGIDNMIADEYIPSPIDLSDSVAVKVVDLLKEMGGRGLFANQDIEKGTCIGVYTGEEYASKAEFERYLTLNPTADNSYAMNIGRRIIDAATKGNFTRYINFSDSQDNVEFQERVRNGRKVVEVIALKNIRQGQQILVNYNTYNENASKLYYFLNPGDGWLSASECYEQNKTSYKLFVMRDEGEALQIKKNDNFFINRIVSTVFANQSLSSLMDVSPSEIDLPILKVNSRSQVLDFKDSDTFTALMIACYLGQLNNVNWLIIQGANVNQQQNHTGNCPLFFALSGYCSGIANTSNYLDIITSLIRSGANPRVHDRSDKSFLHKAIESLSNKDFKTVIDAIKEKSPLQFDELYGYIDENDFDIVQYALKAKQLDKVRCLLEANSGYLSLYRGKRSSRHREEIALFKVAIQDYDPFELNVLYKMLGEEGMGLPESFLERMGLCSADTMTSRFQ